MMPAASVVLLGGTIFGSPSEEPIRDGVVIVQDGTITAVGARGSIAIPPGVPSLDCSGLSIAAGFWNSHVHFFERKWANAGEIPAAELARQLRDAFMRFGFTSVFDTGSAWANTRRIRDRVESGEVAGPRILSTGEALVAPGSVPSERILSVLGTMSFPLTEIVDSAQAATASRKLLDEGVDGIKAHLQAPEFPRDAIPAVVSEAHRSGKPVFVHPANGADILATARAGVDVILHTTPHSGPWDEATLAAMAEQRVALTPTLTLWKWFLRHDRISTQEKIVDTAVGQLRAWVSRGGAVLFGTDLGAVEYDPSEEYVLMAAAGMSFRDILASLTTAPAERFGGMGKIAKGSAADLVVFQGDPSSDIRSLASVRYTIRSGKIVFP
jgi:imidazolonepropionase-like amidohydrolase